MKDINKTIKDFIKTSAKLEVLDGIISDHYIQVVQQIYISKDKQGLIDLFHSLPDCSIKKEIQQTLLIIDNKPHMWIEK